MYNYWKRLEWDLYVTSWSRRRRANMDYRELPHTLFLILIILPLSLNLSLQSCFLREGRQVGTLLWFLDSFHALSRYVCICVYTVWETGSYWLCMPHKAAVNWVGYLKGFCNGLCVCVCVCCFAAGCEFFREYKDNSFNPEGLQFDWSQVRLCAEHVQYAVWYTTQPLACTGKSLKTAYMYMYTCTHVLLYRCLQTSNSCLHFSPSPSPWLMQTCSYHTLYSSSHKFNSRHTRYGAIIALIVNELGKGGGESLCVVRKCVCTRTVCLCPSLQDWDLVCITQSYLKLFLRYIQHCTGTCTYTCICTCICVDNVYVLTGPVCEPVNVLCTNTCTYMYDVIFQ